MIEDHPEVMSGLAKEIFAREPTRALITLHLSGTAFQLKVWRALIAIPAGSTQSYSEVAARIGRPDAARAVGSAIAANPVAVMIPCHRVLPASGGTGNYRWGAARKRQLLQWEAQAFRSQ